MDGGQITAIIIVAIVMLASIVRVGPGRGPASFVRRPGRNAENRRLRDEVSSSRKRLKVLERIAVEKENSLANEIESLRDR